MTANAHLLTGRNLVHWLRIVDDLLPNVRSAMGWAADHDISTLVQFDKNLMQYWLRRSRMQEGVRWLQRARQAEVNLPEVERGWIMANLARLLQYGRVEDVDPLYHQALAIAQAHRDEDLELTVRIGQVMNASLRGDHEAASAAYEAAMQIPDLEQVVRRVTQPTFLRAMGAMVIGLSGDLARAREIASELLQLAIAGGDDIAPGLLNLIISTAERARGDLEASRACLLRSLETYDAVQQEWNVGHCLVGLAGLFQNDHPELSLRLAGAADRLLAVHGEQGVGTGDGAISAVVEEIRHRLGVEEVRMALHRGAEEPWRSILEDARVTPVDGQVAIPTTRAQVTLHGANASMSPREVDVLRLLVDGLTDREIAEALGLSYRTITTYVSNILIKLDVPSRTAAVSVAVRSGLLDT